MNPLDVPWKLKQMLARPGRYYGDGGTIHSTGELDVETRNGQVVAVWFRCQMLPFRQADVSLERAREMASAYADDDPCRLTGVEVVDPERPLVRSWDEHR